jgi:transcriptional regulator with XRE-family HTH domain
MHHSHSQHIREVARTLQRARAEAGLSLRELARRAGTSHATLSAYEQGKKMPSVETFLRILRACGYAVDIELSPRIRQSDGVDRGAELEAALELAAQFPARHARRLAYPRFAAA